MQMGNLKPEKVGTCQKTCSKHQGKTKNPNNTGLMSVSCLGLTLVQNVLYSFLVPLKSCNSVILTKGSLLLAQFLCVLLTHVRLFIPRSYPQPLWGLEPAIWPLCLVSLRWWNQRIILNVPGIFFFSKLEWFCRGSQVPKFRPLLWGDNMILTSPTPFIYSDQGIIVKRIMIISNIYFFLWAKHSSKYFQASKQLCRAITIIVPIS